MKKKTVLSFALALALMVTVIGTATSAFAATSAPMEPVTKIATENEDAIWEQIEAVEGARTRTRKRVSPTRTYYIRSVRRSVVTS